MKESVFSTINDPIFSTLSNEPQQNYGKIIPKKILPQDYYRFISTIITVRLIEKCKNNPLLKSFSIKKLSHRRRD